MYLDEPDERHVVIDIEGDDLLPNVKNIWTVIVRSVVRPNEYKVCRTREQLLAALPQGYIVIGHNFLSYDAPALRKVWGVDIPNSRIIDTLVMSFLYWPKMPGGHSLEAYGERFGVAKDLFNDFSRWSQQLEDRCIVDTEINLRAYNNLRTKMRKVGFSDKSLYIEHRVRFIIDKQERRGFYFDVPRAEILLARLRQEQATHEDFIHQLFPPQLVVLNEFKNAYKKDGSFTKRFLEHREQYVELEINANGGYLAKGWQEFNIGSPPQRLQKLLSLGFIPTKLTKGGNPSVDEESLVEFAKESGIREVQAIADWLVLGARSSMLESWLGFVGPDSRIHGRVMSCGAGSRRMTHNSPNSANIPSNDVKYGKDVRSLWTATPGLVEVGYDAKAAQMRCFAHLLPDPANGRRFYDTEFCKDPHQENADLIGVSRKIVKNVFYANMFGAYPKKLATTAGMVGKTKELVEYGTWIQNELYRVTPGLKEATLQAQAEFNATAEHWLRCPDGGFVRAPSEHSALNYKIQPAEACLMKQAMIFIEDRTFATGIEQWKVGDVHDEGQHETQPRSGDELGKICVQAIRDAGEELSFRVPTDGDYKVGANWAECH